MIYSVVTQSLYYLSTTCTGKEYTPIFVISAIVNSLLCILLIPVTIRLAGQLIAQVFKYRYILNNHIRECDDDSKVITAYYQHFQIFLGIVLCMFGFCIFDTIYLIYTSVSLFKREWDNQYRIGYLAGVVAQSFQEGIILFGVTLLLQIANYFKGKKVQLKIVIIAIIARMGYVLFLEFSQIILKFIHLTTLSQLFPYLTLYFDNYFFTVVIYGIDLITRVFTVFAFMRMCIIIVHKRIIEFITHLHTNYLERERYEDKIRAYKLMKIAAWGTYSLILLNVLDTLSCIVIYYIIEKNIAFTMDDSLGSLPPVSYYTALYISLAGLFFISILSILPSILYSIFLVIAWLVFRHRTKVRYSGFRTNDVTREQLLPNEPIFTNQDHLHQTHYKYKNRVHLVSYVVLIISVSGLFSLFLTPLMIQRSREGVILAAGEYSIFKDTHKDCAFVSYRFGIESNIPLTFQVYPEFQDCSANLHGLKFQKPFKQSLTTLYNISLGIRTWIPQNSTISKHCHYSPNEALIKKEFSVVLYSPSESPLYPNTLCSDLQSNLTNIHDSQGVYHIKTSGIYFIIPSGYYPYSWCIVNITRSIDLIIDKVPYSHFSQGTNIADLDAIIDGSTTDKLYYGNGLGDGYCQLNIVCYYNPVWPILFCIALFLISLLRSVRSAKLKNKRRGTYYINTVWTSKYLE